MAIPLSYNLRNVRQRWRVTLLAIFGIALVVAVFIALLALANGLRLALAATGRTDNGIIVQRGSQSELTSGIGKQNIEFLSVDNRVARNADGRPLASPELVVAAVLPRKTDGAEVNVQFRGVTPMAFDVRGGIRIIEGRNLQPGLTEVIVGKRLVDRFRGAAVGDMLRVKQRDWKIVGIFVADGSSFESEVWGDLDVMASAFNRNGAYQSLTVRMSRPARHLRLERRDSAQPAHAAAAEAGARVRRGAGGTGGRRPEFLALFVSIVMGIGAVFGAMNTMYAVVSQRTREIGTLRALGFSRLAILTSFVIESVLIALVAGLLGCVLALPANWLTASTGNVTFSEIAFAFRVTPMSLVAGVLFATVMGLVGGLLPALRAARMPLTSALREA